MWHPIISWSSIGTPVRSSMRNFWQTRTTSFHIFHYCHTFAAINSYKLYLLMACHHCPWYEHKCMTIYLKMTLPHICCHKQWYIKCTHFDITEMVMSICAFGCQDKVIFMLISGLEKGWILTVMAHSLIKH